LFEACECDGVMHDAREEILEDKRDTDNRMRANLSDAAFEITIKSLSGNSFILDVEPSDTIIEIKNKIYDVKGVPTRIQRLNNVGRTLEDDRILSDYNIQRGSVIYCLLPLRAGNAF